MTDNKESFYILKCKSLSLLKKTTATSLKKNYRLNVMLIKLLLLN